MLPFVTFTTSQKAAVIEHVLGHGIQSPVVAFTRITRFSRNLDEAIVQRQIVSDGVLPGWKLLPVVRKSGHDEFANAAQR